MNRQQMIDFFKESVNREHEFSDGCTYWWYLGKRDDKELAIVLGWQDGIDNEDDGYELCMKLAYLPKDTVMSEYSVDWIMPYDEETMEVDDTETVIWNEENVEQTVNYLIDVYNQRYFQEA